MSYRKEDLDALRLRLPDYLANVHGTTDIRRNFSCPSPKHEDEHPSASYFVGTDGVPRVKCFVCDYGGDVIDLARLDNGLEISQETFREGVRLAAEGVGFALDGSEGFFPYGLPRAEAKRAEGAPARENIFEKVFECFCELYEPEGRDALDYLREERCLTDLEIMQNAFGFAPDAREVIPGFPNICAEGGWIVLPFPDSPKCSSYSYAVARPVGRKKGLPKECKPRGPAELWHGFALQRPGTTYVCEGVYSAVSLAALLDVPSSEVVSLMGESGKGPMLKALRETPPDRRPDIVLALDNDKAGREAADELAAGLKDLGLRYKEVFPEKEGTDWNNVLVEERGRGSWRATA